MKNNVLQKPKKGNKIMTKQTIQLFNRSTIQHVKAYAFTLAEVLIVIGIIGVVAALTLPNLNHATGDKERVTKVKKIYAALNDAYDRAQVVYGDATGWWNEAKKLANEDEEPTIILSGLFVTRISEFMKVSKIEDDGLGVLLNDGTYFEVQVADSGYSGYYQGLRYLGSIYVDLDGYDKGKDKWGYDEFRFDMTDQGIYPEGIHDANIACLFNAETCDGEGHYGATRWILENENLDYLKADEDGVCPNGAQLNWTTQTSCN